MKSILFTNIPLLSVAIATLIAPAARPSAAGITTNTTTPFCNPFINACNGRPKISAGMVHVVATTTFDGAECQT